MHHKRSVRTLKPVGDTAVAPALVVTMFAEGVRRHAAGQANVAETVYKAVIALQPLHAEANYNLGLLLQTSGKLVEAAIAYRNAIIIRPDYAEARCNLGTLLQDARRLDEAEEQYRQAIATRPDFAMAYCNLGVTLKDQGRFADSVAAYHRAITLKPDYDWAYANLGATLLEQGNADEAIVACQRAIAIKPDLVMAHFNLGTACKAACRLAQAREAFERAITLRPDFAEAHFSLAQVLLLQGDFAAGWADYEWRWKLPDYGWLRSLHGDFAQPRWAGEALEGRRILLYAEQGIGDAIQYARFVPIVQRLGGTVVLAVHTPLVSLFATLPGVTVVPLDKPGLPDFDVHCPLLSLPGILGIELATIPAEGPYLQADPAAVAHWRDRVGGDGLRVGIVWAGNPGQTGDRLRSPRLAPMYPLFSVPGVRFVALQVGAGRQDIVQHPLPDHVVDLGGEIRDFADTAAIVAGLDLVISSCTAPLHLAGAMGVPVWGMIPFSPHFAWLMGRDDSPWYPSLKLYRQDEPGTDWSGAVARVAIDLATRV